MMFKVCPKMLPETTWNIVQLLLYDMNWFFPEIVALHLAQRSMHVINIKMDSFESTSILLKPAKVFKHFFDIRLHAYNIKNGLEIIFETLVWTYFCKVAPTATFILFF